MAKKFLTDINIAGGVYDSSGDIGSSGQVLSSTGSGINWIDANSAASVVYQDGFTGNGSTTAFTLANSIDNENKTQVYIDGVYQHKDNYSLSGTTLTFSTAPPNSSDIEVISFSSVSSADDILYDTDFGSAGLMTTNGSGVYSITTNNSANWDTAYGWGDHGLSAQDKIDIGNLSGTNTGDQDLSSYATQSYVGTQISNLVDSSPATLNTLNELAAALGDDPNFATTTANSIGLKAPLASPSFTGNATFAGDVTLSAAGTTGEIIRTTDNTEPYFALQRNSGSNGVGVLRLLDGGDLTFDTGATGAGQTTRLTIDGATGNATFTGNITFGDSHFIGDDASDNLLIQSSANENIIIDSLDETLFRINGSTKMQIKSSGNVGIGTTSPVVKLAVKSSQEQLTLSEGDLRGATFDYRSSTGNLNIATNGINARTNPQFTLDLNGNVGIGVTPFAHTLGTSASLDLKGNGGIWGYAGATYVNSNAYYSAGWKYKSTGEAATLQVGGTSNTLTFRQAASGAAGGVITYTEVFRVHTNGNVGIGNSNPLAKLQITSGDSGASSPWSNADELILESSGNAGLAFQTPNTGAATIAFQDPESVQAGFIQYLHADNALRFATNGNNERMRITSGGNIIFGNAGPQTNVPLQVDYSGGNASLWGQLNQTMYFNARPNGTAEGMAFQINGSTDMFLRRDGNVGIGTTSPSVALDVTGEISSSDDINAGGKLVCANVGSDKKIAFRRTGANNFSIEHDSSSLYFYNESTTELPIRFFNNGNVSMIAGNVGIGTTSPSRELDIQASSGWAELALRGNTGAGGSLEFWTNTTKRAEIFADTEDIVFRNTSTNQERMRITSAGKVGINENAPAAKLQVSGDRDGNSEYVVILGEDGGANGAANSGNITPVHKTLLTGYSIPYSGQTNARLTSVGFLEFDSTPGWTGNQRNWALTSGYDMGGTNGPKFAILMGDAQNVEPQLGTNGAVGTGDGANTRVAAYWKNTGDMVLPEGGLFVKNGITGDTNNANNDVVYLRTITIPYTGSSGSFTFDIDPVAEFGTRVSGGRLHLAVSGWQSRMNAGYIVYRNNGTGTGKIGTGNVTYFRYIWSETSGSQAEVAVSLISSSTNVIRISFSGWHSNDHGFEARLTATS